LDHSAEGILGHSGEFLLQILSQIRLWTDLNIGFDWVA
jgi:hypothetical protein